jgi:alpha-D-ribose 1-methylphosphonate 5-triphosphate synthase subunit PhnG
MPDTASHEATHPRAAWMRLLALAGPAELEAAAGAYIDTPHDMLRKPETGMVMLRGRMGSTGAPFNLGEATVTRCAVRLASGTEGHAYVLGRDHRHARIAAICDALLQQPDKHADVRAAVLAPIARTLSERHMADASKAAATKVDFFTMVRGDD